VRITFEGISDLENTITSLAAIPATKWDAEKDDKLLTCVATGNSEEKNHAFNAFYRRHEVYLYGICYNLVNRYKFGHFSEEDIFQLTMAKARERAGTFKADGKSSAIALEDAADAWLGGIAKHAVLDLIRRKPPCVPLDSAALHQDDDGEQDKLFIQNIEQQEDSEDMKLIREAIDTLSIREKEVAWAMSQFYVRREHQRTPTEELDQIVESLGISRENFRKIKERVRRKINQYVINRKSLAEAK
jgi:RNA polymerase sigma factor (sigma-70 family)